ncbi:MAG TPA: hypothetical protein VFT99_23930, partial [Roseiflexaceae bacterium]|nr:hypothetical protein [Roseiflexaceae bacterium]
SLVDEAAEIVEQRTTQSIEELEHRVAANLLPGHNSAYNDLLVWRQKLASLQLPDRPQESPDDMMLGASAEEVDYLYQIWLFYELVDLIQRRGGLIRWQPQQGSLTFRWGQGEQQPTYVLRHDRAIPQHWRNAPGVRPDLYIAHVDRYEVRDGNALIWHEPGFVLDAKYYKPRDSSRAPSSTVKRMIADLHLTGERYGALLFAFQRGSAAGEVWDTTAPEPTEYEPTVSLPDSSNTPLYRVTPQGPAAQRGAPDEMIAIWRISPRLGGEANTEQILEAILDEAHAALQNRLTPKCHGIFADSLSITAEASLHERFGSDLSLVPGDILICPKPHVGTWRTDIVSRSRHCCSDARLCHIVGQPDAQKPVRQPRDINDLLTELDQILGEAGQDTLDEYGEAAAAVAERIQRVTRAFAEFAQVDFEFYYNRLRDLGMSQTL